MVVVGGMCGDCVVVVDAPRVVSEGAVASVDAVLRLRKELRA